MFLLLQLFTDTLLHALFFNPFKNQALTVTLLYFFFSFLFFPSSLSLCFSLFLFLLRMTRFAWISKKKTKLLRLQFLLDISAIPSIYTCSLPSGSGYGSVWTVGTGLKKHAALSVFKRPPYFSRSLFLVPGSPLPFCTLALLADLPNPASTYSGDCGSFREKNPVRCHIWHIHPQKSIERFTIYWKGNFISFDRSSLIDRVPLIN